MKKGRKETEMERLSDMTAEGGIASRSVIRAQ